MSIQTGMHTVGRKQAEMEPSGPEASENKQIRPKVCAQGAAGWCMTNQAL